jgi:hypothetical protein
VTTNADIARRRLANQRLVGKPFGSAVEVVGRLGAVQAQDYSGAKWAIAQRTRNATDAAVERCIARGDILRTHVLRPTWHFVLPADIRWMLTLTAPRVAAQMASNNRRLGLTPRLFARANDALARALEGGTQLIRAEIAEALHSAGIDAADGLRLGHMLMQAELDAVICSGARRDKQITYALLDERAPSTKPLDRDEALTTLAQRYFSTRSPATPQDFAWWSGLTVGDAKRAVAAARVRDHDKPTEPTSSVHLLPNYDEFFIAYRDRRAILDRVDDIVPMQQGTALFAHVIEIDGQLVGGWRRVATAKSLDVETTYVARVTAAERRGVAAQIERYKAFAMAGHFPARPPYDGASSNAL